MKTLQEISQELKKHLYENVNEYNVPDENWQFYATMYGTIEGDFFSFYLKENRALKIFEIEIGCMTKHTLKWIDIIKSIEPEIPVKYYKINYTEKTV